MQVTTCFISHSSDTATSYADLIGDSTMVVPPESSQFPFPCPFSRRGINSAMVFPRLAELNHVNVCSVSDV